MGLSTVIASDRKAGGPRRSRRMLRRRAAGRDAVRPGLEWLEWRGLMTSSPSASIWPAAIPHETLDQAAELGQLAPGSSLQEAGSIGGGPQGAADVVWYRFTLQSAGIVHFAISRQDPNSSFNGVLSLFNNDTFDYFDPYNVDGYHLIDQIDAKSSGGVASFNETLGQGTYYLAVSGDGNLYFHPLLAGSGLPGSTGAYDLQMSIAFDPALATATGPQVLTSDPASGASIAASPLAIRINLSGAINASTINANDVVLYSADYGMISLASVNFSPVVMAPTPPGGDGPTYRGLDQLQLFPSSPLLPGSYEVILDGQGGASASALADYQGNPLGANAANPGGQIVQIPFTVTGIEGQASGVTTEADTAQTALPLGNLSTAGLVQVTGAIGNDPGPDTAGNPANQVNLYHFTVVGPGQSSFIAQIFAGRIGSPLQAGLSLFKLDPSTGALVFVAGDLNSYDPATTTDGFSRPLYSDPLLEVGLTAGDYYIAVADAANTPSPLEGQFYDPTQDPSVIPANPPSVPYPTYGLYDPNIPGSAQNGYPGVTNTGAYVLNLLVQPAPSPPHVVSTSISPGSTLSAPPEQFTVRFDQPMNLAQIAFQSFQATTLNSTLTAYATVPAVYIAGSGGIDYVPRFVSYDAATNEATFQMLNALPDGSFQLHLSGPSGLTDLGGNPLVANDPSGDYVVPFTVNAPPRGVGGNPLLYNDLEPNDTISQAQNLGPLFPDELVSGVTLTRNFSQSPASAPHDTADVYAFQILLDRTYNFTIVGSGSSGGFTLSLEDASGKTVLSQSTGGVLASELAPGTYFLVVGGWTAAQAPGISYQVAISMATQNDNAPPLVAGPAPAMAIELAVSPSPTSPTPTSTPTSPTPTPPPIVPPPPTVEPPYGPEPTATTEPSGLLVAGPSPSGSMSESVTSSSEATSAGLSLAIPSATSGLSGYYGPVSTSVSALGASPVGGATAPEGAGPSATMLAQFGTLGGSPAMATSMIVLGTSLQVIATGDDPPPPGGDIEAASTGLPADAPAVVAEWSTLIATTSDDHPWISTPPFAEAIIPDMPAPMPPLRVGMTSASPVSASVASTVDGAVALASGPALDEKEPGSKSIDRVRVALMTFAAIAAGAYARCRGIVRRDTGHGSMRGPARQAPASRRDDG